MRHLVVMAVSAALLVSACGKSEQEKQAEETKQAAEQASKGAESIAKSAEQMAKGVEQMAKGLEGMAGGGSASEPVSFRELGALFPEVSGWARGKPTGERMTSPAAFSQAEVTYTKGDMSMQAKIIDSAFNQALLAPYAVFLTAGYERETEDGYEKSIRVGGSPGWERWSAGRKHGELNAIVGKRFLLVFEGDGLGDTKPLHDVADGTDLNKLASLR